MELYRRVDAAFTAYLKAQAKVNRCRRPEAIEAAREEMRVADAAYRKISDERDVFMEIRRAQRVQGRDPTADCECRGFANSDCSKCGRSKRGGEIVMPSGVALNHGQTVRR